MPIVRFGVFDTLGPRRMNLYLILTIALGAISGVVEAPVARPALLVSRRENGAQRRVVRQFSVLGSQFSVASFFELRTENREPRTNRGNTAPRAPAFA
jgi:hypothetical protein